MLETFYFLSQILAAIAVVASLVFVGMQIRANTREQRQRRVQDRSDIVILAQRQMAESPEHREVYLRGLDSFDALTPSEKVLYHGMMMPMIRGVILYRQQYLDGDITDEMWQSFCVNTRLKFGAPGIREWFVAWGEIAFGATKQFLLEFVGTDEGRAAYNDWRAKIHGTPDPERQAAE